MDYFELIWLILVFAAGFVASRVWNSQVKRSALIITRTQASAIGVAAKAEQSADLKALLMEAGLQFKKAKEQGEDIKVTAARVVPELIQKYPDVIAKHGKKLFKMFRDQGGFEGLQDMMDFEGVQELLE